ncbi:SPOR domain-containing protein [Wenzhouxiangella sp. EGI_FJ10305]|uniref:SPOR domain-containing protein n=1 Tax=Wenzhouxiangella sp. EGI_FJ10305 TaxID=3243768 RepID=UPI0035E1F532
MARRQAKRSGSAAAGGLLTFGAGLVSGLVLATLAWLGGYLPGRDDGQETAQPSGRDEPPIAEEVAGERSRQYDFFTVLPEREVVVPQEEIAERARERDSEAASQGPYVLQVGSFRSGEDAESQRAKVTLLGLEARVQSVTVDDVTWHRVRVGPFDSAREADGARRRLVDNGFEAMVLKGG